MSESPPPESKIVTKNFYRQAVKDAREVHMCRADKHKCERDKDACTVRAQDCAAREAQKDDTIASLSRRPTWGIVLLAASFGAATALCVPAAQGELDARVPCGVSVAVTTAVSFAVWRW
jgi:hypothetical protein